jgi:PAS domain-containing protein
MRLGTDEPSSLIHVAMDQLAIGIAVLDRVHTLKFANPAYRSLLELPEQIAPLGVPFSEILDHLIKRGEFRGHVAADLARQRLLQAKDGHATTIERGRPNGQWIKVQLQPLADGGILIVCLDVTDRVEQRWRSEGQILDLKTHISELEEQIIKLRST